MLFLADFDTIVWQKGIESSSKAQYSIELIIRMFENIQLHNKINLKLINNLLDCVYWC